MRIDFAGFVPLGLALKQFWDNDRQCILMADGPWNGGPVYRENVQASFSYMFIIHPINVRLLKMITILTLYFNIPKVQYCNISLQYDKGI